MKESVDRGDIKQMSFGFKVVRDNWIDDKETLKEYGMPIREVEEIALHEISLVTFPAYPQTNVRHTHSANEDAYIPTPPQKSVINDGFDDRSNEYEDKNKASKNKK
ncbi:HK97 family phage prohead protease [Brachyspira hyodysenteriae]|nr:HK97 family phage prohead protease [Brachyspira hyodysenteriae]MCZ9994125.1 HK97 family phage prohead protease [Brachyspira hyodysenteriae]